MKTSEMKPNKVTNRMRRHMRDNRHAMSLSELATIHDVEPPTILWHTRDMEPPSGGWPKGGMPQRFCREAARRLEAKGMSRSAIARRLGVTQPAVTMALGPKLSSRTEAST